VSSTAPPRETEASACAGSGDARQWTVEHKAIAFIDCCGFTAYTREHGDLAAVRLHLELRRHLEREAHLADVHVVKWNGDGAMLAAEDTRAALTCLYRAMISLRRARLLPVRAGLSFGSVTAIDCDGLDFLGASVNRAAELCSAAAPWQVRADFGRQALHFRLHTPG